VKKFKSIRYDANKVGKELASSYPHLLALMHSISDRERIWPTSFHFLAILPPILSSEIAIRDSI